MNICICHALYLAFKTITRLKKFPAGPFLPAGAQKAETKPFCGHLFRPKFRFLFDLYYANILGAYIAPGKNDIADLRYFICL